MARFLIRRILQGLFVIWAATVLVFIIFFVGPGPQAVAHRIAGKEATQAQVNIVFKDYKLNLPVWDQYWHFLDKLLHANLGTSYYHQLPVSTVLKQDFPATLSLTIGAAILWLVGGVLTGVLSAVRRGSIWDRLSTIIALILYSAPVFVVGSLLLLFLSDDLGRHGVHFFPGQGYTYFSASPSMWFRDLILPWFTLASITAATYTRLTRGSMLDVMGEDYIRTARAKGLRERRVIYRHTLRSALTPVVSQFGIDVGTLLGGAIITEYTFGISGLGKESISAVNNQDLPVIIGIVLIATIAVVVANIVVDMLYAVLDPRVRLH